MTTNVQLMYQKSIVFFYLFTGISILFFDVIIVITIFHVQRVSRHYIFFL